MSLRVNQSALRAFRRRACEAYPLEYVELLGGTVSANGDVRIEKFFLVEQKARPKFVIYEDEEIDRVRSECKRLGLLMVGSIHSHPNAPEHPSEEDNWNSITENEFVFGILSIRTAKSGRKYTCLAWWPTQHSLERVRYFQPAAGIPKREAVIYYRGNSRSLLRPFPCAT